MQLNEFYKFRDDFMKIFPAQKLAAISFIIEELQKGIYNGDWENNKVYANKCLESFAAILKQIEQEEKPNVFDNFSKMNDKQKSELIQYVGKYIENATTKSHEVEKQDICANGHDFGQWEYTTTTALVPNTKKVGDIVMNVSGVHVEPVQAWKRTCKRCGKSERTTKKPVENSVQGKTM